jgi:putative membrane protein
MLTAAFVSFAHFLAFYAMTAALVLQLVLLSEEVDIRRARRIRRADAIYGLAALAILGFGFMRVYYFEKGADYYFSNIWFITKLVVFILMGILSTMPTRRFLSWKKTLKSGKAPVLSAADVRKLRLVIHAELTGIGIILLCAALMAHGLGSF